MSRQSVDEAPWGLQMLPETQNILRTDIRPQQPSQKSRLESLPLEIIFKIIAMTDTDGHLEIISTGCHEMITRWSLKRVNRFFWLMRGLHAPSDFFIRQYHDINIDRIKQMRLMSAFGPDQSLGLMPCFQCRRFYPEKQIDKGFNGSVFFYEGRDIVMCYRCTGGYGHRR